MTKPFDKVLKARLHECIEDVEALEAYVSFLLGENRMTEAGKWVAKAIAAMPDHATVAVVRARWLLEAEQFEEARAEIQRARSLGASQVECLVLQTNLAVVTGKIEIAIVLFEDVMRRVPNDDVFRREYARLLLNAERWDDARVQYEELLRKQPEDLALRIGCAEAYLELERFERARFLFEQVLRDDPDDAPAAVGVAESLYAMKREDDALRTLEEFIAERPKSATALEGLFSLYRDTGHLTDAVEIARRLFRIEENAELRLETAMVLVALDRDDEAIEHLRRALSDEDIAGDARCVLADIALKQRRFDEAEMQLARALDTDPELAYAYETRGRLRHKQLRIFEARRDIERSIELDPNSQIAWSELALLLNSTMEFESAVEAARKAVALDASDLRTQRVLAAMLLACADLDGAAKVIADIEAIDMPVATKMRQALEAAREEARGLEH